MANRIKGMWARLWRPRRRRAGEHGFHDPGEAARYRADQVGESARGQSYKAPEGPPPI